jgi:hypothetical protein
MVDTSDIGQRIETRADLGPKNDDVAIWAYWMGQEKIAEKEERKWIKQAREIVKRYRDERPEAMQSTHRFNVLWSNVETLKPTLYGRTPKPDVRRTFNDDDPVGLFAAELLQRCLEFSCTQHNHHFDSVMKAVVEDRLLPGRAVARVLYVPHYGELIKTPEGNDEEAGDTFRAEGEEPAVVTSDGDEAAEDEAASAAADDEENDDDLPSTSPRKKARELDYEEAVAKYVFWEDYREGPARQWDEVPWTRYRAYLNREQLRARFGKKKGDRVNLDYEPKGMTESVKTDIPADLYKKACVHEYWDRDKKQVIWLAPGTPDLILDSVDDPLKLPGFFPNPDPLLANSTNDKRIPVPDYIQYQDQARELDKITSRIDKLTGALQVKGFYPGDEKQELQQLIDEGTENKLIPIHDWQRFIDKGGIKDIIQWMPIQQIAECLIQLYQARDRTKAILYELTGMSDILRGQTSPVETKGAQDLKARFATRRIAPKQKDVADFACNLLKLKGAIIAEHFSAKTISVITGFPQSQIKPVPQLPPMPQQMIPNPAAGAGAPAAGPAGAPPPANSPAVTAVAAPAGQMQPGQISAMTAQPPMMPNPQFAQWQKMQQAIQQLQQANQAEQKKFDDAVALIKSDGIHGFRIDIEADSTIAPDEEAEQVQAIGFIKEFVPFIEQIIPQCMGNPAFCDFAEKLVLFAMRPFKVARTLEEATTKLFEQMKGMPPPPPKGADAKGGGADSPQDLAVRTNETQVKQQIARDTNAVKEQQIASNERIKTAELALEAKQHHDTLAEGINKEADQRAFRDVRAGAIEAKEATALQ